ncbi:MAG: histidine kinase dimerization/phosphoacceptor domain-containing protein, partial [Bacteroidota bacterium]
MEATNEEIIIYITGMVVMIAMALVVVVFAVLYNKRGLRFKLERTQLVLEKEKQKISAEIQSQEKERERISKHLHDNVNNQLTIISMQARALPQGEISQGIQEGLNGAIQEIR